MPLEVNLKVDCISYKPGEHGKNVLVDGRIFVGRRSVFVRAETASSQMPPELSLAIETWAIGQVALAAEREDDKR